MACMSQTTNADPEAISNYQLQIVWNPWQKFSNNLGFIHNNEVNEMGKVQHAPVSILTGSKTSAKKNDIM